MSDLVIACPRIVADRIENSTETWQDVRQAEDLPRSLFTGHLRAFHSSGNNWTAWYESRGFEMLIENKAESVTVKETHWGELLSLCIYPRKAPESHNGVEGERKRHKTEAPRVD